MKANIEKEVKELQALIDDVVDDEVSQFTINHFEKLEELFFLNRDFGYAPLKNEEVIDELNKSERILQILNPELKKDIEYFTKLNIMLKNIL